MLDKIIVILILIIPANAIISVIPRISIKIVSLNKGYAKTEILG